MIDFVSCPQGMKAGEILIISGKSNFDWDNFNKPHLIMTAIFDKVQFMYWRNRDHLYSNDIYYNETLGMDGIE